MSTLLYTNSNVPASILERSKMSLISWRSKLLLSSMICIYSCLASSSSSSVEAKIPEKPTMAFRGVRISWLIFAKKADFNLLDSSALSLASISASSIIFL